MPAATKTLKSADTSPKSDARAHPPPLPPASAHLRSPASRSARDLFVHAGHELAEAATATHPYDRYCGAHLAAIRAASAVVEARRVPAAPRPPHPARHGWELLYPGAPEPGGRGADVGPGAER